MIIVLIIIVLLVLLYLNNSEHFAGNTNQETKNQEIKKNIVVRADENGGGYYEFLDKDGKRQSFISGQSGGVYTSDGFFVNGKFSANNGSLLTGEWDKLRIYTKKDNNDKGFFWFNKDGVMGFAPDGANSDWSISRSGMCFGSTCISEGQIKKAISWL